MAFPKLGFCFGPQATNFFIHFHKLHYDPHLHLSCFLSTFNKSPHDVILPWACPTCEISLNKRLITQVVIVVTSIVAITTPSLVMRFPITWSYLMRFWIIFMYLMMLCLPFYFCCVSSWFQINNLLASVSQAMRFSNFFETSFKLFIFEI